MYPSGIQCTNPIPKYLDPLLCGGHCDNIRPPEITPPPENSEASVRQKITLSRGGVGDSHAEGSEGNQQVDTNTSVASGDGDSKQSQTAGHETNQS